MPVPARNTITFESAESQVLANLRAQPLGAATVGDLGLPESFLRRVAGRVLQLSFQENFRLVVAETPGATEHEIWKPGDAQAELHPISVEAADADMPEGPLAPAEARGFSPRVLAGERGLPRVPSGGSDLAGLIAKSLAKDGLLVTAAKALRMFPGAAPSDTSANEVMLRQAGFPVDLLRHFEIPGKPVRGTATVLQWLSEEVVPNAPAAWARVLKGIEFKFQPTLPGFRANDDAGHGQASTARTQISRGGYWIGPGDGGSIDVLSQVADAMPTTRIVASIEERHLTDLRGALAGWPAEHLQRLTLVAHPFTLSQWAQDNAKDGHDSVGPATLIPRYATRGEEISLYVPGDTYAAGGLAAAGLRVAHSPLLFQGGNLLTVQEPSGRRVLLVGEAEVYRNQSLGLTRDQAVSALCTEMGCDKGVVLPAASIHIDYEVSCRATEKGVTAFVLDTAAGARMVIEAAAHVLVRVGLLSNSDAATALTHIGAGRVVDGCSMVWAALVPAAVGPGRFPIALAREFREGHVDSGVGNLHRLMAALDLLISTDPRAADRTADPNLRVYLKSLARRHEDRSLLRATLRNLGWTVVAVPGLGQGDRSINPLNGLHLPDAYLMPAYGGLYANVDAAAQAIVASNLGPQVRIVPIRTGESQRRDGALRCSVALG